MSNPVVSDRRDSVSPSAWRVDVAHSAATFVVGNLGRRVTGTVPIRAGSVTFGADGCLETARGVAELGAIDTGNTRRDMDLRKQGLLDLDNHPMAAFDADQVSVTPDGWCVAGYLTARGSSTRVEFDVTRQAADREGVTLCGQAVFDRRELGIRAPRIMIGRMITITITARIVPDV